MLICSKQLSFIDLCIPHFVVESASKFSLCVLWKMVLFMHDFQTWQRVQSVVKCKYFLLFHHNNIMLKTDIMLDYCNHIEKGCIKIMEKHLVVFRRKPVQILESV